MPLGNALHELIKEIYKFAWAMEKKKGGGRGKGAKRAFKILLKP